jgi:hypothetical protein
MSMNTRAWLTYARQTYEMGQPCKKGERAGQTGCIPASGASSASKRAGARVRGKAAKEAVSKAEAPTGVFERAKKVREIAHEAGVSPAQASRMLDKKMGTAKTGLVGAMQSAARAVTGEIEHWDHQLEGAGVASPAARKAVIGGYIALKVVMGVTGLHGPLGIVAHEIGHAAEAVAYWSGADAITTLNAVHAATKMSVAPLKKGVSMIRKLGKLKG